MVRNCVLLLLGSLALLGTTRAAPEDMNSTTMGTMMEEVTTQQMMTDKMENKETMRSEEKEEMTTMSSSSMESGMMTNMSTAGITQSGDSSFSSQQDGMPQSSWPSSNTGEVLHAIANVSVEDHEKNRYDVVTESTSTSTSTQNSMMMGNSDEGMMGDQAPSGGSSMQDDKTMDHSMMDHSMMDHSGTTESDMMNGKTAAGSVKEIPKNGNKSTSSAQQEGNKDSSATETIAQSSVIVLCSVLSILVRG